MRERLNQWWQRVRRKREGDPLVAPAGLQSDSGSSGEPVTHLGDGWEQPLASVSKSLARLAREQAKANLLWEQSLAELRGQIEGQQALLQQLEARAHRQGREEMAQELFQGYLGVLDGLYQAAGAMNAEAGNSPLLATWAEGLYRLHARGEHLLQAWDVLPLTALGQPFDPKLHRPVEVVESAQVGQPTVIAEVERGYRHGDRLLRYAAVVVARPGAQQDTGRSHEGDGEREAKTELASYLL